MQCTITASYSLFLFWPFWQSLENKRVLPDWMAKEFVIRVPRSEDFCTVSAAMKQCKNGNCFCIKPIQSSFCHSDTLICMNAAWNNSRFSCTLDVNTTWSLISTDTKALIKKPGRILRRYKLYWLKQMSMWSKEAQSTSIFYKRINQRGKEINF